MTRIENHPEGKDPKRKEAAVLEKKRRLCYDAQKIKIVLQGSRE